MRQFFERSSKPDWCAALENFVIATVNECHDATLYGSWASREETLVLSDGQYHVMSDIDVSYSGSDARMQLLQKKLNEVIPYARIDHSDVFAFANKSQTKQRLLAPSHVLEAAIEIEEIAEATAIRTFYSSLDIWSSARRLDFHGIVYSLVRLIAEIPLYFCWNAGLICGSYRTQLDIAVERTSITQQGGFDLVRQCVECKISVIVMRQDIDEWAAHQLIQECVRVFQTVIGSLHLDRTRYGVVSFYLLDILRASLKPDLTLVLENVESAWNKYRESVPDGRTRHSYLSKKLLQLKTLSAGDFSPTHSPFNADLLRTPI